MVTREAAKSLASTPAVSELVLADDLFCGGFAAAAWIARSPQWATSIRCFSLLVGATGGSNFGREIRPSQLRNEH